MSQPDDQPHAEQTRHEGMLEILDELKSPTANAEDEERLQEIIEKEEKSTRSLNRFWHGVFATPGVSMSLFYIYTAGTLPLGLLLVGAGLDLATLHRQLRGMAIAAAAKLLLLPAIVFGLARLLGLDGAGAVVAVVFTALPTAPTAYVLAEQMGGDAPLMAAILTLRTLLAIATLPLGLAWIAAV